MRKKLIKSCPNCSSSACLSLPQALKNPVPIESDGPTVTIFIKRFENFRFEYFQNIRLISKKVRSKNILGLFAMLRKMIYNIAVPSFNPMAIVSPLGWYATHLPPLFNTATFFIRIALMSQILNVLSSLTVAHSIRAGWTAKPHNSPSPCP